MSKDKISDYSATANSNTDIGGINIDEGCAPSGINDAIRTLMKQLKDWQSGSQDVYIHPAGSASVPSITATGDTNTGLFFPAADTVGITTGGTERARVDSSGNLGLGVTPSAWQSYLAFQMNAGSILSYSTNDYRMVQNTLRSGGAWKYINNGYANAYLQDGSSGGHAWFNAASGTAGNAISFTQAMTLDASGNLGIGTTSPSTYGKFAVLNNTTRYTAIQATGVPLIRYDDNSAADIVILQNSGITGANHGVSIQAQLGDNVTNTATAGYIRWITEGTWSTTAGSRDSALTFATTLDGNTSERARIDSSGNLLVGTTSTIGTSGAGNTHIQGNTNNNSYGVLALRNSNTTAGKYFHIGPVNDNGFVVYNQSNTGVYITDGGTSWSSNSDERIKDIIEPITNAANKVSTLRAVIGKYKKDEYGVRRSFLIAQDVQAVLPEAVNVQQDEMGTLGVQYTDVIPLLVAAIKEQQAIITQLQADVAALKGQA